MCAGPRGSALEADCMGGDLDWPADFAVVMALRETRRDKSPGEVIL